MWKERYLLHTWPCFVEFCWLFKVLASNVVFLLVLYKVHFAVKCHVVIVSDTWTNIQEILVLFPPSNSSSDVPS